MAAGLAMTAAALVAANASAGTGRANTRAEGTASAPRAEGPPPESVTAPVRIADAATVRLLHPGDHVDVIAADTRAAGGPGQPRVVAKGARVVSVPEAAADGGAETGALVVLSVPRPTATRLAGAGTTSPLAVTLC